MQHTVTCNDCVVTFVLRAEDDPADEPVVLDIGEARTVRLLSQAGLIPKLRFDAAG